MFRETYYFNLKLLTKNLQLSIQKTSKQITSVPASKNKDNKEN